MVHECGDHEALLKQKGIYANLVGKQLLREQNSIDLRNSGVIKKGTHLDVVDSLLEDTSSPTTATTTGSSSTTSK
jgi:hypothetical protein